MTKAILIGPNHASEFLQKCSGTLGLHLLQLYVIVRQDSSHGHPAHVNEKYDGRTFVFICFFLKHQPCYAFIYNIQKSDVSKKSTGTLST